MEQNRLQSKKVFVRRQPQFWKMNHIYKDAPTAYSVTVS